MAVSLAPAEQQLRESSTVWRVLIIEDDAAMCAFFADSVQRCPELTLIGTAGSVAGARTLMSDPTARLDVLLVDLELPDGSGLDLIRFAAQTQQGCECLVISMFGDDENVLNSVEAGALGYIHKDAAPEDISATILEMKRGASPISPLIARRVLSRFATQVARMPLGAIPHPPKPLALTTKEHEVLELIARGFSYAEIARLQGVTVHTVQTHIKNLYSKLSVHSRSEAVFEASRMGLLNFDHGDR
ncbi:MAG: response regulator transcription factor [Hydrogenophaga sp.]|uniref:response regulator transcription factor n=1 Tax=Hydrogenophaga sp. TaxID=1904254 RepID=UPI00275DE225|nr:response regulator transcription factor [Hydrogenophaga sp.]MDP2417475.1 response regulator transcription factor [Hydrogenophaga sp.]MDZ4187772.1 response regulator transcription factor [Hydrogenophaga sp.]